MSIKPPCRLHRFMTLLAFLGTGALTGCATLPAPDASPAWRQGMAVQLYSFHRELERDLPGTLRHIKTLGFDRVETYPVDGVTAAQLRAALDAAGLDAVSAHMPWERMKSDIAGVIADVQTLGAEQFGPGSINLFDGRPFRNMTLAEAEEAGTHLAQACTAARAGKLRVFIHTHGNELANVGGTAPLDRMLETAGHCFEIEADLAWVQWAGVDPSVFIARYGPRVSSLHIKDIATAAIGREFGSIDRGSFTIVGQGSINWPEVARAARSAGVRYYVVEDESNDPGRQIAQSLRHLDSVVFTD